MKNRLKRLISGVTALAMVFSMTSVAGAAEVTTQATTAVTAPTVKKGVDITIVHTNDVHARVAVEPYVSAMVKGLKAKGENVLLVSAGDVLHGQTIATISKGATIVDIMNATGYDVLVPGNHDFNYGTDRLLELEKSMKQDVLAANVATKDGKDAFKNYIIKEYDGVKVGIFGLATPETATKTNPLNVENISFQNPTVVAKEMVAELQKQNCDVIIAVTHLGLDQETLPGERSDSIAKVDGVDIVIDGHSHTVLQNGKKVGKALIAQTGEYGNNIGVVTMTVDPEKHTISKAATLVETPTKEKPNDNVKPDGNVEALIAKLNKDNEKITSKVIGETPYVLQGERADVRTKETNLSNLVTDAMLYVSGADIAITNGGGIRASIPAGKITMGDVLTVLPFGNYVVKVDLKGSAVLEAIEHGISAYPEPAGHMAQFAGVFVEFDASKPAGSRIVSAKLTDGTDLDPNKVYKVATNDFMVAGGDKYTMLATEEGMVIYSALDEAVISLLEANPKAIRETAEGRLVVAKEAQPATEEVVTEKETEAVKPAEETQKTPDGTKTETKGSEVKYVVKKGDCLAKIAREHDTTVDALVKRNGIKNKNLIFPGQVIYIPVN